MKNMIEWKAVPFALVGLDAKGAFHVCVPPPDVLTRVQAAELLARAAKLLASGDVHTELVKTKASDVSPGGSQDSKEDGR